MDNDHMHQKLRQKKKIEASNMDRVKLKSTNVSSYSSPEIGGIDPLPCLHC